MIWDVTGYITPTLSTSVGWLAPVHEYRPLVKDQAYLDFLDEKNERRKEQKRAAYRRARGAQS